MECCRICGLQKPLQEFKNVFNFTKYKKHKVIWCRDCQRMYVDSRKSKELQERMKTITGEYCVTFS